MKKTCLKAISALLAASSAVALTGCGVGITVNFGADRPWHSGEASYEQLNYTVSVYDTTNGDTADKRVKIADGALVYSLTENTRSEGAVNYATLDMAFSLTYNDAAPEADVGKTDEIQSSVEFQNDSLVTSKMNKTVTLAPRESVADNSYTLSADYFGEHKATRVYTGKDPEDAATLDIPSGSYYDNETMFYVARATDLKKGSSTQFYMTGLFDCFIAQEFEQNVMAASVDSETALLDLGSEMRAFGGTDDDGYVPCMRTSILMNKQQRGPAYYVYYSEKPFEKDGISHSKMPVTITYSQYSAGKMTRITEYVLTDFSFVKPQ